jgi:hypothetical protein
MNTKAVANFDDVRAEHGISQHYEDAVLAAFAGNWLTKIMVDWQGFEDAYVGIFDGNTEIEALGEYAREINEDEVPGWLLHYVNWTDLGRDMKYGGEYWAAPIGRALYVVFSNL